MLCTSLEATGLLGTSREYFSRSAIHHNAVAWDLAADWSTPERPRPSQPREYVARVLEETFDGSRGGHKIHWYQFEAARALRLLDDLRNLVPAGTQPPVLLRTRRRDVAAQAVSAHIADSTREYYR